MKKTPRYITSIKHLGDSDVLDPDVTTVVEDYVCAIYGVGNIGSVNDARVKLFNKCNRVIFNAILIICY